MDAEKQDAERMKTFLADFAKLKSNREKVPLQLLQTRYASAYNALIKAVSTDAEWFALWYLHCMATGEGWTKRAVSSVLLEERKPGGLYQQMRDALVVDLDMDAFERCVWLLYLRVRKAALRANARCPPASSHQLQPPQS